MITFSSLAKIINGKLLRQNQDHEIKYISIDSRKTISSPGTLFFAIKGERHDGHNYIEDLLNLGIENFIVENNHAAEAHAKGNFIQAESSVKALQLLACRHRSDFSGRVIGITGSSGKTIVKEWLFQLLQSEKTIFRSPKSYNSQVGVPLSVWQINEHHDLAIIEAGISKPGEMEKLEEIIKPDVGIFTNIGTAHDAGFASREEKAREKARLFRNSREIIYCADDLQVEAALKELGQKKLFSWSAMGKESDLQVSVKEKQMECHFNSGKFSVEIPGNDKATIDNSAHCVATLLCLEVPAKTIQEGFSRLTPVSMRLELKKGINNCSIIDDTYNNDLMGLEMALDFLTHQSKKGKKTIILSEILTSGLPDEALYEEVNSLLDKKKISRLIGVGERISKLQGKFSLPMKFFSTTEQLLEALPGLSFDNETILVKGARDFRLERVVEKLTLKIHQTVLEINLDSLTHNLNYYKSKLNPGVEIMAMVKAFAYGSGSVEIARWLQFHQVDYLAVAYADEGVMLRNNNVEIPIMVMNPSADSFDKMVAYNLEPEIYSKGIFKSLLEFLKDKDDRIRIHLKVDTGMHRLGFGEEELREIERLLKNEKIIIESVFTHLAAQENEKEDDFTRDQVALFEQMYNHICDFTGSRPKRHVLNSAGILRFPEFQFERVRLGIGLYGIDPLDSGHDLIPISIFRTAISQIKKIRKGETIGYSRLGKPEEDIRIATIPVGYADGYDRRFGNGTGYVVIKGRRCRVIGNVCMDMTMVELGDLPAQEGDEVIIYGPQNSVQEMAGKIGTIPYELLTGIGDRVKRIFVQES